eukprot:TRINITY_DN103600_c0_g1_i1.p1 TRINITY_DN103600_c0_g1~~TRINITY_DN103600_c0_g1_i1.p1  ORF type:complete len:274 (+),score=49.81 TRINITY_DN103600_c0_g1_i1:44-865(+)
MRSLVLPLLDAPPPPPQPPRRRSLPQHAPPSAKRRRAQAHRSRHGRSDKVVCVRPDGGSGACRASFRSTLDRLLAAARSNAESHGSDGQAGPCPGSCEHNLVKSKLPDAGSSADESAPSGDAVPRTPEKLERLWKPRYRLSRKTAQMDMETTKKPRPEAFREDAEKQAVGQLEQLTKPADFAPQLPGTDAQAPQAPNLRMWTRCEPYESSAQPPLTLQTGVAVKLAASEESFLSASDQAKQDGFLQMLKQVQGLSVDLQDKSKFSNLVRAVAR